MEEFKPIEGFEDYYISNFGRVLSKWFGKERYLKPWLNNKGGHFKINLHKDKKPYSFYIHRLVLETFVGKCPENMECRHLDGNPKNNHVENLKWGTRSENSIDKFNHGYYGLWKDKKRKPFTDEHRRKMSEAKMGKKHTDETKRKISEALKSKKHTDETRRKMSESQKKRWVKN